MNVDQFSELAEEVLACVVSGFAAAHVLLPPRQFTHYGMPAIQPGCEQLVVTVPVDNSLLPSIPGRNSIPVSPIRCVVPRAVGLQVWITRCCPHVDDNGQQPSSAEMTAASLIGMRDIWTLANVLVDGANGGCYGTSCDRVELQNVTIEGPEGGVASVIARLLLQLTPTR